MNQNFRKFSFDREFLVMRNLALSFYSLKHLLSHYNYLSLPILVLSFLNRTILKLFFLTIMLIFICLFMKSSFFSYKFQDIVERLDQKRSNRLQRNNYSNENFQTKSFLKKIYDRIFKRKTTKIKSLADEYNVNISLPSLPQKSSISYPPLPHFETDNKPIKIKILFQKLKKIICEFLKPKKPFSNPTNPYIKKLIIQTKIEEKSKASDKITAIVNPNPKKEHPNQNQIYRISKKRSSLKDHQDISLKKRFSTTPKNALQNLKTGSLSKNLVSFDLPSSQRQSSLNSQTYNRKKGHLTRSVSLKHLKENPIPSFLLARYDALKNEAEICFEKLNIEKDVDGLIENCKEWVFEEMISKLLRRNVENVIEINKILKTHYCKRLKEFDHLYDYMIEENKDDVKEEFISLNDLLNSVKVFHFWKVESTDNKEEKQKVQKNLLKLINDRKRLDIDLTIPGFDISQIRLFILIAFLRLIVNKEIIQYSIGEKKDLNMPSDTQILAQLFSNYLFYEIFGNESQYFYSFLLNSTKENYSLKEENCFFPFDLFLQQTNPFNYEPHFQIIYKGEIWQALPGKNNLFCAIALFFKALSLEMRGNLKNYQELYRIMNLIFG